MSSQLNSRPPGDQPSARITLGPCEGGDLYWTPQAGQVPVEGTAVILGWTVDGQPVVLATCSLEWLDDLEEAIRTARAQGIVQAGMMARVAP